MPKPKMPKINIESTVREALLIAGFFMLGYGLWLVYRPAAWSVCGALLIWVGLPPKPKGGD